MARQRFIWPNLWDDPQLGRLTDTERLLYIGCFSMADDDGRLIGEPAHLRSTVYAFRPRMSLASVTNARTNISQACSQFHVYEVAGVEYIQFLNWGEWQKPKYPSPSKLPPPPGMTLVEKRWLKGDSGNGSGTVPEGSPVGWVGLGLPPKDPPKRKRQRRRKAPGDPATAVPIGDAWQRFVDGIAWDDVLTAEQALDELHKLQRSPRSVGHISDQAALEVWNAERERRYPPVPDPVAA